MRVYCINKNLLHTITYVLYSCNKNTDNDLHVLWLLYHHIHPLHTQTTWTSSLWVVYSQQWHLYHQSDSLFLSLSTAMFLSMCPMYQCKSSTGSSSISLILLLFYTHPPTPTTRSHRCKNVIDVIMFLCVCVCVCVCCVCVHYRMF